MVKIRLSTLQTDNPIFVYVPDRTACQATASHSHAVETKVQISMHTRSRTGVQTMKKPANYEIVTHNRDLQRTTLETVYSRRFSRRERKIELEKDIEKLRKKLKYEENVHRALERAFTRPLGALPRLPPYLSAKTLELLAEVAVLEEEVVRLEEQIVHLRQGLYQEAVYISLSRKQIEPVENSEQSIAKKPEFLRSPSHCHYSVQESQQGKKEFVAGGLLPPINECSPDVASQAGSLHRRKASFGSGSEANGLHFVTQATNFKHSPHKGVAEETSKLSKGVQKSLGPSEPGHGKENQLHVTPKTPHSLPRSSKPGTASPKSSPKDNKASKRHIHTLKVQTEHAMVTCNLGPDNVPILVSVQDVKDMDPNRLSEEMVKCLLSIFLRLAKQSIGSEQDMSPVVSRSTSSSISSRNYGSRGTVRCKTSMEISEEIDFRDPYGVCADSEVRDIGPYKHLHDIITTSIDLSQIQITAPLLRRLKVLVDKLSSVDLKGLSHQQKLAFWINIYNVCMMNAFLEHGLPSTPQMVVAFMRKGVINVGGHSLNALTIEHFILRLPYHSKDAYPKGGKKDKEATIRSVYGLEWPEPLVTFALSCGSRSSPAVRVYTASGVENELEAAKKEYLQAAVGVTSKKKLLVPKLLDWYSRDFAKDVESLLDWICLQLPTSLRNAVMECLERRGRPDEMVSQGVQIMPYEFDFRYLFAA